MPQTISPDVRSFLPAHRFTSILIIEAALATEHVVKATAASIVISMTTVTESRSVVAASITLIVTTVTTTIATMMVLLWLLKALT